MNLKNKFCRSVDLATFTPPLTKIPGSAPETKNKGRSLWDLLAQKQLSVHRNKFLSFCVWEVSTKISPNVPPKKLGMYLWASQKSVGQHHLLWCPKNRLIMVRKLPLLGTSCWVFLAACLLPAIFLEKRAALEICHSSFRAIWIHIQHYSIISSNDEDRYQLLY